MARSLTKHEALKYLLGFDPVHAIVIALPGRAPWLVPPTEDPRELFFDGVCGDLLVREELQTSIVQRAAPRPSTPGASPGKPSKVATLRPGDTTLYKPSIPVPPDFVQGRARLGWRGLQAMQQFLREFFPRSDIPAVDNPPVPDVGAEHVLLDARDDLARRLRVHFSNEKVLHGADVDLRAGVPSPAAALLDTLRAVEGQWSAEDDDQRAFNAAEQERAEYEPRQPEFPEALAALIAEQRDVKRAGHPVSTGAVVRASLCYGLQPRDTAMLVGLEKGHIEPFGGQYDRYFEPGNAGRAAKAWAKIHQRPATPRTIPTR